MVAANAAVLGALDLLVRGHGGHVDLSQLEAMAATMGPAVLGAGSDDPHGVYPAAGTDRWVAITAQDETQRAALRNLTGSSADDAALAAWTRTQDADELAARLQAAGVAAAVVATGQDLVQDEHLAERGFYQRLDHPIAGPVLHEGIVARLTATPGALTSPAPLLGQHTEPVLRELLGFDDDRLAALRAAGITE